MKAKNRPRAPRLLTGLAVVLGCLMLTQDALAQASWNRRCEAVSVTEDPATAGLHDIHVVFEIHTDGSSSLPTDLTTGIDVFVNRSLAASHTIPVGGDPGAGAGCVDASGCGSGCGSGSIDGVTHGLLCLADGACNPICDCKCKFPPITWTFPGYNLQPGDEIMVILYPAPGAWPDSDTSDDNITYTFQAPVWWDRTVSSVSLVEVPTGSGMYDVHVDGTAYHEGLMSFLPAGAAADLGMTLDLQLNGVVLSSMPLDFQPVPIAPGCLCAAACATWGGGTHQCTPYINGNCMCGWPWLSVIPGIPLTPGDEIMVLLRPAPGALPELPGFEDDESDTLTCCSSPTGVETLTATVAGLLQQNRPNPFVASTTIAFSASTAAPVSLELFDVQGRRVRTLVDDLILPAGSHAASWDGLTATGERAPAGVYFYRLVADGRMETRKMTLTK